MAVATFRLDLRVARFKAERTFSLVSFSSTKGALRAAPSLSWSRSRMVKSAHSELWACSRCSWAFKPSGPPHGTSLEEMMQNFERRRDKEFASHVCAGHPRTVGKEPGVPKRTQNSPKTDLERLYGCRVLSQDNLGVDPRGRAWKHGFYVVQLDRPATGIPYGDDRGGFREPGLKSLNTVVIEWEKDSPASVEMVSVPEPADVAALSETRA